MLWPKAMLCPLLFFSYPGLASPVCKAGKAASEASADTWGMASASWKLWISFGDPGRKAGCALGAPGGRLGARQQHRAHPHRGGASEQSRGGPEKAADKTNFVSLCLSFGDGRCVGISQLASERPALRGFTRGSLRPNQYSPLHKKRAVC